jgi:NADH:ubiquinone oxidoreductase subunit
MKTFFLRFFTWWNGQTFGTQLWTWRFGELVGQDEFGNRYYRTRGGEIDPTLLMERRWVIYNGEAEASSIPPSWHGLDAPHSSTCRRPGSATSRGRGRSRIGRTSPARRARIGRPARPWRRAGGPRPPATTRLGIQVVRA